MSGRFVSTRRFPQAGLHWAGYGCAGSAGGGRPVYGQHVEIGRQAVGQDLQRPGDLARRDSAGTGLHQQAEDRQAPLVAEGGEHIDSGFRFHISNMRM